MDVYLENNPLWLHWLEQTPSTNSWALAHASQLQHGDVVFTPRQTAGRGQGERQWLAPPGVLTASFILDGIAPVHWPALSLASGLAVIYAIEDLLPIGRELLRIKWPNDVWCHQRKLAGILAEGAGQRVIVGIGCNRQVDFGEWRAAVLPISLHQIQSPVPSEILLLERFRHYLLEVAGLLSPAALGLALLLPELRRRDELLNTAVCIESLPAHYWSGTALGIDAQGCYQIQGANGEIRSFAAGRIRPLAAGLT
jgi:BirA family transcriptional regulator, biotin operon repressor / biotin---[acetyl-CoA-carboxylase] ligase